MIWKLNNIAQELLAISDDISVRSGGQKDKCYTDDAEIYVFNQTWPTTALGFDVGGGLSGQAFTTARTWVIGLESSSFPYYVYFGGEFAYEAEDCQKLREDIMKERMEPVSRAHLYKR